MKLLNHPHIIKLYQVRTQVCLLLLLLASVLCAAIHLQFLNFAHLWLCVAVRELVVEGKLIFVSSSDVFSIVFLLLDRN